MGDILQFSLLKKDGISLTPVNTEISGDKFNRFIKIKNLMDLFQEQKQQIMKAMEDGMGYQYFFFEV